MYFWGPLDKKDGKEQGRRATFWPLLSSREGCKRTSGLALVCGVVVRGWVWVCVGGSSWCWLWGVSLLPCPLGASLSGGGTCTTFALHFSLLGLGKIPNQLFTWPMVGKCHSRHFHRSLLPPILRGVASPAAPLPPPLPLSHNFCHRLRASRILAHRDKSHHFHSRGAHFPPGLKMRCAEGLISSSKG